MNINALRKGRISHEFVQTGLSNEMNEDKGLTFVVPIFKQIFKY